jgi:hypothetical protein
MRRGRTKTVLTRLAGHSLMGISLGLGLGCALAITNAGRVYSLITGPNGPGAYSLVLGFAAIIGVGAAFTGFIFDEVEKS